MFPPCRNGRKFLNIHIDFKYKQFFYVLGTFGQPDPWDIYNPATYHHPMVPYDVLIDPMSLPSHPVVAEKQNMHQIIHEDMAKTESQGVRV